MGDKVLKKISIILICTTMLFANNSVENSQNSIYQKLDKLFNSINQKRYGLTKEQIDNTRSPFINYKEKKEEEEKKDKEQNEGKNKQTEEIAVVPIYTLQAILNNRANINGGWYGIGNAINDYKLIKINRDNVILDNVNNKLKLTLEKGSKNVIIETK